MACGTPVVAWRRGSVPEVIDEGVSGFMVEDIDEALAELKAKGTPLLNDEPIIGHANCRIAFIDPKATGNLLFELAEMPKDGPAEH